MYEWPPQLAQLKPTSYATFHTFRPPERFRNVGYELYVFQGHIKLKYSERSEFGVKRTNLTVQWSWVYLSTLPNLLLPQQKIMKRCHTYLTVGLGFSLLKGISEIKAGVSKIKVNQFPKVSKITVPFLDHLPSIWITIFSAISLWSMISIVTF